MFFKYFLRNLGLRSFRHLDAEKNAWIIDKMLDNIKDDMKTADENDEDQTSNIEVMKSQNESPEIWSYIFYNIIVFTNNILSLLLLLRSTITPTG